MIRRAFFGAAGVLVILSLTAWVMASADPGASGEQVSGRLVDGFRILTIESGTETLYFRVYRGDYIKFAFDAAVGDPVLSIPALAIGERLPTAIGEAPYFKMKAKGTLDFSLGRVNGRIEVVDYRQAHYRELSVKEAARHIEATQPLILDVRTPGEFERGRIAHATLIPVQELERRLTEIAPFKDREILIYCATGNRSTVASKILIDNGFVRVSNLRHGIVQWIRDGLSVVHP